MICPICKPTGELACLFGPPQELYDVGHDVYLSVDKPGPVREVLQVRALMCPVCRFVALQGEAPSDPACSGGAGVTVHHTCGKSPDATKPVRRCGQEPDRDLCDSCGDRRVWDGCGKVLS